MKKFKDIEGIEEKIDEFFASLPSQSTIPFPPIKVERVNLEYANLLLNPLASSVESELQAITQYIYHSKTISNETISKALLSIALIEMGHLDALSELIPLLGGKPFYQNSNNNFWMAGNIAYVDKKNYDKHIDNDKNDNSNIKLKLENDINAEKAAINGFYLLLKTIKDKYIEKILIKIISDEQVHVKILEDLIEEYL